MRQKLLSLLLLIALLGSICFIAVAPAEASSAVITGSAVNLRKAPGTDSQRLGQLTKGTQVTVLASKSGWYQVAAASGLKGWVSGQYLKLSASSSGSKSAVSQPVSSASAKVVVTGTKVNLRKAPSTSAAVVGQVKKGDVLNLKQALSGWYKVTTRNGTTAYISSSLSVIQKAPAVSTSAQKPDSSATSSTASAKVVVTGTKVNLRKAPSTSAVIVGQVKKGDVLNLKQALSGWYKVTTKDGKTAYISSSLSAVQKTSAASTESQPSSGAAGQDNTEPSKPAAAPSTTAPAGGTAPSGSRAGQLMVTGSIVNLRSGPGTSYPVITKVKQGQVLYASREENGWYEVGLSGDEKAWISGTLVRIITPLADSITSPPSTPSRGNEERPELKAVSLISGEDDKGDYLTLIGEDGVTPAFSREGNRVTVTFPGSRLDSAGIPGEVYLDESKTMGIKLTPYSQGTDLKVLVLVPSGLNFNAYSQGSRVVVRVPGQFVSVQSVSAAGAAEALEMRFTSAVSVDSTSSQNNDRTYTISGADISTAVNQSGSTAYESLNLTSAGSGRIEARVRLRDGYQAQLLKVKGDLYRIYFTPLPKAGTSPTIVVDPGHGGSETGAIYFGTQEKDLNLSMALKLGQALEQAGCRVVYTRTDDRLVSLSDRVSLANTTGADIFVSIHCNAAANPDLAGTMTFYYPSDDAYLTQKRKDLAARVQQNMISRLGTADKGVRTDNFYVIKYTTMPSILVETAFLSNSGDYSILSSEDCQWTIAHAICDGIKSYLENTSSTPSDKPPGW